MATREGSVDRLSAPADLGGWLAALALPQPAGGLTGDDLAAARLLRAAIERVARRIVAGVPCEAEDVRAINASARRPTPVILLGASGRERTVVPEVDASGVLAVVARDAVHLFSAGSPARLRECARDRCSTLFYDRSPSGRRRWCAMKGCGERVASASYRQRRRAALASSTKER